jgi:hypothetical protein
LVDADADLVGWLRFVGVAHLAGLDPAVDEGADRGGDGA